MTILYSAIARESTIICSSQQDHKKDFGSSDQSRNSFVNENYNQTNYSLLVSNILPNISTSSSGSTSYTTNNEVMIHVLVGEGLVFLCASHADTSKRRAFDFLSEIKSTFTDDLSLMHAASTAGTNDLNRNFAHVLSKKMVHFTEMAAPNDNLSKVQAQVEEVKGVMVKNIEAVLDRGQKLEDLIDKSNDLEANASSFQRTTRRVHRKMWWKNMKMNLICGVVAIIALIIIILVILFSSGVFPIQSGGGVSSTTVATPPANLPLTDAATTKPPLAPAATTTITTTAAAAGRAATTTSTQIVTASVPSPVP